MHIYVGGLWSKAAHSDLEKLVARALRGPWYKFYAPRGQITACDMKQMTDVSNGQTEYCAVIEIEPSRLGWEVVQFLEGFQIHGHQLTSHKWFPRTGMADRRASSLEGEAAVQRERREGQRRDRRRHLRILPLGGSMIRAVEGFERSYGS